MGVVVEFPREQESPLALALRRVAHAAKDHGYAQRTYGEWAGKSFTPEQWELRGREWEMVKRAASDRREELDRALDALVVVLTDKGAL